jgi:hypothetical protein
MLWGAKEGDGNMRRIAATAVAGLALALGAGAGAADTPRYDVPAGYTRCPKAEAWNGFFKWASVKGTTCSRATTFMRAYAAAVTGGHMPRRAAGFRCAVRYWRNGDGDVYASRQGCRRGSVAIRFYGMS